MTDRNRPDARPSQDRREDTPLSGGGVESLNIAILEFEQMLDRYDRNVRSYVPQPPQNRSERPPVPATALKRQHATRGVLGAFQSIVLWALIIAAFITLAGCDTSRPTEQVISSASPVTAITSVRGHKVYTFEHDGHLFIRCSDYTSMLHHPDCNCGSPR